MKFLILLLASALSHSSFSMNERELLSSSLNNLPEGTTATPILRKKSPNEIHNLAMAKWNSHPQLAVELLIDAAESGSKDSKRHLAKIRKTKEYKKFFVVKLNPQGGLSWHVPPQEICHFLKIEDVKRAPFDYFAGETMAKGVFVDDKDVPNTTRGSKHRHRRDGAQKTSPQKDPRNSDGVDNKRDVKCADNLLPSLELKIDKNEEVSAIAHVIPEMANDARECGNDEEEPISEFGENTALLKLRKLNDANAKATAHTQKVRRTLGRTLSKRSLSRREDEHPNFTEPEKLVRKASVTRLAAAVVLEDDSEAESELSVAEMPEEDKFRLDGYRDRDLKKLKTLLSDGKLMKPSQIKLTRSVVTRTLRELGTKGRNIITWNYEKASTNDFSKITATHNLDPSIALVIHLHSRKGKWYNDKKIKNHFLNFVAGCDEDVARMIANIKSK